MTIDVTIYTDNGYEHTAQWPDTIGELCRTLDDRTWIAFQQNGATLIMRTLDIEIIRTNKPGHQLPETTNNVRPGTWTSCYDTGRPQPIYQRGGDIGKQP